MIDSINALDGTFKTPIAAQTDNIEKKKNLAYRIATFGAYPSFVILLAVRVQKFSDICDYPYNEMS